MSATRWLVEPGESWSWRGELAGGVTTEVAAGAWWLAAAYPVWGLCH